jgi:hypothetical protein
MVKCKWLLSLTAFTYKSVAAEKLRSPTGRQALNQGSNCMPLLYTSCKECSAFHLYLKQQGSASSRLVHTFGVFSVGAEVKYRRQRFPLEYYKVDDKINNSKLADLAVAT